MYIKFGWFESVVWVYEKVGEYVKVVEIYE